MAADDSGPSIWTFIGGFVVLAVVGLTVLLVWGGSPTGDTHTTKNSARFQPANSVGQAGRGNSAGPGSSAPGVSAPGVSTPSASSSSDGFAEDADTPVTFPGGAAAPSDVREVLRTDDTISLAFKIDKDAVGTKPLAVIPPVKATPSSDDRSLVLEIGCARSSRESLAQVSVSMIGSTISVTAVSLVPTNASGCDPSAEPKRVTVPLEGTVGTRIVSIAPEGTEVDQVDLG